MGVFKQLKEKIARQKIRTASTNNKISKQYNQHPIPCSCFRFAALRKIAVRLFPNPIHPMPH
jgi:hypothetical protein